MEYRVSDQNRKKVEEYFVKKAKELGTKRIEATVIDIAEGANVALATAHRALKEMAKEKVIKVIKPKSRRFPIQYVYNREIEEFEKEQKELDQIQYLQNLVSSLSEENKMLKQHIGYLKNKQN